MWENSRYCWVVLCKNHWYHVRKNILFRYRIVLAETDAVTPRPAIDAHFRVRCDECGKEYFYKPSEVLRFEQEPPESFTPHPLFRDEDTAPHAVVANKSKDATKV
jgi:hypothetical protein